MCATQAFAAGVTRALSTAVIFLELAGENHLRGPLAFATLIAHYIGNRCGPSIYDALTDASAAPVLRDPGWFLTTKGASLSLFTSGGVKEARSPGASRGGRTTPQSTPQTVAGREER